MRGARPHSAQVPISIDHIAEPCRDPEASAAFLASILGIPVSRDGADDEFFALRLEAGASLLFTEIKTFVSPLHFALRVTQAGFAAVVSRLRARSVPFGNDPEAVRNEETRDPLGGHGRVYFQDPNGHLIEVCA